LRTPQAVVHAKPWCTGRVVVYTHKPLRQARKSLFCGDCGVFCINFWAMVHATSHATSHMHAKPWCTGRAVVYTTSHCVRQAVAVFYFRLKFIVFAAIVVHSVSSFDACRRASGRERQVHFWLQWLQFFITFLASNFAPSVLQQLTATQHKNHLESRVE